MNDELRERTGAATSASVFLTSIHRDGVIEGVILVIASERQDAGEPVAAV